MRTLAREIDGMELPAIEKISEAHAEDPFQILIGTLLSARTQDATTHAASTRLFRAARTPKDDGGADGRADREADLPGELLPQQSALREGHLRRRWSTRFGGKVPRTLEELVTLPGVGRKTANLVMILAFQSQQEHLRRYARAPHLEPHGLGARRASRMRPNRRSTQATEQRWWPLINLYLVTWGQNVCRPIYPRCGDVCAGARLPADRRRRRPAKATPGIIRAFEGVDNACL